MQKIDYRLLPVYEQKERILKALEEHQAVVVQSPTGSGKTTQLPVILYEASYAHTGMIAVTQPRRIAALSVSEFIAKQLNTTYPGLVGYKMRYETRSVAFALFGCYGRRSSRAQFKHRLCIGTFKTRACRTQRF